jgi:uncharacterized membrane protein
MDQPKTNKFIFVIPVVVAIISMSLLFAGLIYGWFGVPSGVAKEFCEATRPGLIKQPYNTWSNLGFIISGLAIAWLLMTGRFAHNNNNITQSSIYGTFYASLVVFLGPASMAMHGSLGELGGFFDMLSMYLVVSFTISYGLERLFDLRPLYFVLIFLVVLSFCIWADGAPYHIIFDFFGDTVFMSLIIITVLIEAVNSYIRKKHHNKRWVVGAVGALIAAFLIWNVSQTDTPLCDPYSPLQGHAAWHILDAVSAFCLFMYYASEHTELAPQAID